MFLFFVVLNSIFNNEFELCQNKIKINDTKKKDDSLPSRNEERDSNKRVRKGDSKRRTVAAPVRKHSSRRRQAARRADTVTSNLN